MKRSPPVSPPPSRGWEFKTTEAPCQSRRPALIVACLLATVTSALGGPPFVTDDPVPVDFQHWEVYLASQYNHTRGGSSGALPQVEVNYGVVPDLQLHLIAPVAFSSASGMDRQTGYGDTEVGAKYRFVGTDDSQVQVAVFPLVEVPTGDAGRGLGSGHLQLYLPLWLQRTSGAWTAYGGAGYWLNPGAGNRNWIFTGLLIQRQLLPSLALGAELFHETASTAVAGSSTDVNLGLIWDLNDTSHVLASAGPTIQGPAGYQAYCAIQFTFGPAK